MRVGITGIGAVTAIGLSAPATMAAQRAGVCGQAEHAWMLDRAGDPMRVAAVPDRDPSSPTVRRFLDLAEQAVFEAVNGRDGDEPINVMLALPEPRPGLPEDVLVAVGSGFAAALRKRIAGGKVKVLMRGHAGGLALIGQAMALLNDAPERSVMVVGVDSWLVPETLEWLDTIEALHSDTMPWGFCPGEAAACCVFSCQLPAASRLVLLNAGHAIEPRRIRAGGVCIADGLTAAWRDALAGTAAIHRRVDQIWCDLNSEPYRGDEIALAVARTREQLAESVEITTPADTWGDVGASSGPLMLAAAEVAARKGYAVGPMSLLSTSSEGGPRAAVTVWDRQAPNQEGASWA